jgi:hypothetical protein
MWNIRSCFERHPSELFHVEHLFVSREFISIHTSQLFLRRKPDCGYFVLR